MTFGTVYSFPGDHCRTIAIKAVAKANKLDLKFVEESKTSDHYNVSKLGKVPAFQGEDGLKLVECIAIAVYITSQDNETTLLGKDKRDYANILMWMSFFNTEIIVPIVEQYLMLVGIRPFNEETAETWEQMAQRTVAVVEEDLQDRDYLVGESLTLADLFCAGIITLGFQFFYGREWRQANPNVSRWFRNIIDQPIYSAALTEKFIFLDEPKSGNAPANKEG